MRSGGRMFHDERGFTTVGMVLALTITLSLIFTTAQVYRLNSASAQVQNVADAAALAAENTVSDYVTVARLCDAVILTLSLTGTVLYGIGIVALCVPPAASVGERLVSAGDEVFNARDGFAKGAVEALNDVQKALPYLVAVRAAHVVAANDATQEGARYVGAAILVPFEGQPIGSDWSYPSHELSDAVKPRMDDLEEQARRSDELAQEAAEAKRLAFERDCGDYPGRCLYERADALAHLSARDNPLYRSVDDWSFSVALERARAYYAHRLARESPLDNSVEEQAKSALRKQFYAYANLQLGHAFVHETDDSFEASFPSFPRNTEEMRQTSLYTDPAYPITSDAEGTLIMHAWPECPNASAASTFGSLAQMEQGSFALCPVCKFSASSLGSVAAASTSIDNGFEYHYAAIAQLAQRYQKARSELDPISREAKGTAQELMNAVKEAFAAASANRIDPHPPGGVGAIALVVNFGEMVPEGGLGSAFVSSGSKLGPRAAVSGATLLEEHSDDGKSAINSLLDGIESHAVPVGAARMVLDCWSSSLRAYGDGQVSIINAVEESLNAIPLASASGLGTWAAKKLKDLVSDLGLQAAKTDAVKPVIINTAHVASGSDDSFAQRYLEVKRQIIAHPLASTNLFDSVVGALEDFSTGKIDALDDSIPIAEIELFDGDLRIPITIPLPQEAKTYSIDAVREIFSSIRRLHANAAGVSLWE